MFKKLFLSVGILFIITSFIPEQDYFEGVITYETTYESNNPNVDITQLKINCGIKSDFYFKEGNYKQILMGPY